jgi:cation diffusion facilitator family transporter
MSDEYERIAIKVTWDCVIGNIFLTAFKFFAGFQASSAAMISDAVHSLSDIFGAFIVVIGVRLASKKSDKEHLYGHERMECVAAIILAVILFVVGIAIGYPGVEKILTGNSEKFVVPGVLALVAAVVSIVLKEAMYWYTRAAAKKIDSTALMAEAWHHRSDALSSVGSFAGIFGARLGFPILDSAASVVICLFILKVAVDIFKNAVGKMTDRSCDDEVLEEFQKVIMSQKGVIKIDRLDTRLFGNRIYVDVEISCDGNVTLIEAHNVSQRVHDAIENRFPKVKHCMVHVNPVSKMQ